MEKVLEFGLEYPRSKCTLHALERMLPESAKHRILKVEDIGAFLWLKRQGGCASAVRLAPAVLAVAIGAKVDVIPSPHCRLNPWQIAGGRRAIEIVNLLSCEAFVINR